jgi:serine protease inhibitor
VLVLLVPMMLVPMMRQASRFSCAEGADYQAVRLPYEGEAADTLVILPDEGGFGQVEGRLGQESWTRYAGTCSKRRSS